MSDNEQVFSQDNKAHIEKNKKYITDIASYINLTYIQL